MRKIALIEDDADNRLLVQAILEGVHEVVEFEDGPSALAGLRGELPDLVLLDIGLPGIDGVEVLRRIRDDAALTHLPIVALTAHAMVGDRERFLTAGFDGYLPKPIVDEDLFLQAIHRAGRVPAAAAA